MILKMTFNKGISLIELCVALIIIGVLIAPIATKVRIHFYQKQLDITSVSLNGTAKAIEDYYFEHDSYPCPADLTLKSTDPTYGEAVCTPGAGSTMTGGVPFRTLKIPAFYTIDGWSNKLTYTVTRAQTTSSPLTTPGAITVRGYFNPTPEEIDLGVVYTDEPGADPYGLPRPVDNMGSNPGTFHFVLISHGKRGVGAYTADGVLATPCPTTGILPLDAENCNNDSIFFDSHGARADAEGIEYYDDMTYTQERTSTRIWAYAPNGVDIFSNAGYIGINTKTPQTDLDVNGNILAEERSHGKWMCDEAGDNCFEAAAIGGTQIECTGNTVMQGIAHAQEVCSNTTTVSGTCPSGKYMIGIDAGGNIVCQP